MSTSYSSPPSSPFRRLRSSFRRSASKKGTSMVFEDPSETGVLSASSSSSSLGLESRDHVVVQKVNFDETDRTLPPSPSPSPPRRSSKDLTTKEQRQQLEYLKTLNAETASQKEIIGSMEDQVMTLQHEADAKDTKIQELITELASKNDTVNTLENKLQETEDSLQETIQKHRDSVELEKEVHEQLRNDINAQKQQVVDAIGSVVARARFNRALQVALMAVCVLLLNWTAIESKWRNFLES
jgi:hypothetical protein